jgi:hypothetical protein
MMSSEQLTQHICCVQCTPSCRRCPSCCWDSIGREYCMYMPAEELNESEDVKSKVSYQKRVYVTKFLAMVNCCDT